MRAKSLVCAGKTKSLYRTEQPGVLLMQFRDDISAFETKKGQLVNKGKLNNCFNTFIMRHLSDLGIPVHFLRQVSETEALVKELKMIRVECVVRNMASGSLCRRLNIAEGVQLEPPVYEYFLKDDALHDPLVNESHILTFGWATKEQLNQMHALTKQVNRLLLPLFTEVNIALVDFKLEFGVDEAGNLLLADEFTPDGCRLWDITTHQRFDKDLFRHDLGDVLAGYREVASRLGIPIHS